MCTSGKRRNPAVTCSTCRHCFISPSSYRKLVMEEEAMKWFEIMPAKERLKEIRAAIADGL